MVQTIRTALLAVVSGRYVLIETTSLFYTANVEYQK
jgi:hypothetical protein